MESQCNYPHVGLTTPATYRIVISGCLDGSWSSHLDGLDIRTATGPEGPPLTTLTGRMVDQSSLFGILNGLFGLGFPLLSVECLSDDNP